MDEQQINTQINENENEQNDSQKYIEAMAQLKANSVSKEKYEKLEQENQQLINALKEGSQIEMVNEEEKPSLKELAEVISDERFEVTNMEGWKKALEFRKAAIEAGMRDPFLPTSKDYNYNPEDSARAQLIADTLEDIISKSNGNPDMFNAMAKQFVKDDRTLQNIKK